MPTLKILANSTSNTLTIDLSAYLNLQEDKGLDPANPEFSNRVWSRSILREGATLAMEQMTEKETTWPLLLNQPNTTALDTLVQQINQAITTAGAIATWQDDGASQPTTFDLLSGVLEIQYTYRKAQKFWLAANLRLFSQPLGRTAGPRAYAAASGVGPLLMISPYASSGAQTIGATTQAGVAGYGGAPAGPSSGIFYPGSPSLAGDAPAQLVMNYVYAAPPAGQVPSNTMVSLLPDANYQPQPALTNIWTRTRGASVPGGAINEFGGPGSQQFLGQFTFANGPAPLSYTGQHRVFALARASGTTGQLSLQGAVVTSPTVASVAPGQANLYDLGTLTIRPSETTALTTATVTGAIPSLAGVGANCALSLFSVYVVPDATTWFLPVTAAQTFIVNNAQFGSFGTISIDDTVGDQGYYNAAQQSGAPRVFYPAIAQALRITPYSRGLVPRPDPRNGLPIIAILGGNNRSASETYPYPLMSAQVQVQERTRYTLG